MTITKRADKGVALTYGELDENFRDLDSDMTLDRVLKNGDSSGRDMVLTGTATLTTPNLSADSAHLTTLTTPNLSADSAHLTTLSFGAGTGNGLGVLNTYIISTNDQFTGNGGSFTLQVDHDDEHDNLVAVIKPSRSDSIFMISTQATAYSQNTYMFWTIGRAINASKTGFTSGDALLNVTHLMEGGDGTSTTSHMGRSHLNAHVNHGAACVYDQPNTTDYVRYSVLFYENGSANYYFPIGDVGTATLIIQELAANYTEVSFDGPLTTSR